MLKAWGQGTFSFRDRLVQSPRQAAGQLSRARGLCGYNHIRWHGIVCPADGVIEAPVTALLSFPGSCQNLVRAGTPGEMYNL